MRGKNVKMAAAAAAKPSRHYDTLILGAGMSGLACASRLYQHQHYRKRNDLLVLEGRERIGGRIESVHVNGCRLDTGANWIHGVGTQERPNPLMGVLPHKRYRSLSGAVLFKAPSEGEDAEEVVGSEAQGHGDWFEVQPIGPLQQPASRDGGGGDRIIPKNVAATMVLSLWSMIGSLHEAASQVSGDEAKRTTMLQAIIKTKELHEAYQTVPKEYHHSLGALPQFIENIEAAPLAAQSAEKASDQPGLSLLEFSLEDFDGDQVFLQDGYTAVVEEMAKDLRQAGLIQLGVQVEHVDWSKSPIQVETSNGSYTARQVVCTLPLGVLQHFEARKLGSAKASARLFVPPLPSDKQAAIESLGFGTLDKILLVYEAPWWTQEPYVSILKKGLVRPPSSTDVEGEEDDTEDSTPPDSIMGFTSELAGISVHDDGTASASVRVLSVMNLHSLTDFPVLSAFVSCANAAQVEAMANEQAGGIVHRALTSWMGREPPKPDAVHVTRWAADEFSRGSYSHMITGVSEADHREEFQRPVVNGGGGTLRFAGEHTSRDHFATVHGALLSGWREADAILKSCEDEDVFSPPADVCLPACQGSG